MAGAKKCDICGAFYEPYNQRLDNKKYPNRIHFARESIYNGATRVTKAYDCCPDCMYQIGALIHDLQSPETCKTEFLDKHFNLPLYEKEIKDEHN